MKNKCRNASKAVYKILVGNKNDLEEKRKVSFEQGKVNFNFKIGIR